MPHILITGCDTKRNIEEIELHAKVRFSQAYYLSPKAEKKLEEVQEKLEAVIREYYDDVESESFTNHAWNTRYDYH